jgi:hypothetical protein
MAMMGAKHGPKMDGNTDLIDASLSVLRERLPKGWNVDLETSAPRRADVGIDATIMKSTTNRQHRYRFLPEIISHAVRLCQ